VRALLSLILAVMLASVALGAVSVKVYRADERTPLEPVDPSTPNTYQDIMVGTRLTLFVVSDAPALVWSGGLWISQDDWNRGTIAGRDFNEQTFAYEGSILPASGRDSHVFDNRDDSGVYLVLDADHPLAGEWFVFDYYAEAPGICTVGLFALIGNGTGDPYTIGDPPPAGQSWVQGLIFNHVPSQDHNGDQKVDFVDFALWASHWKETVLPDPNDATASDPDAPTAGDPIEPHTVDARELALFCTYWLEQTDVNGPAFDPNAPEALL